GDHFGVVAAQPLAADRETANALAFGNAGHLQQRQCATAGAEEHEACTQLAAATLLGVLDLYAPAFAIALNTLDLLVVGHLGAVQRGQIVEQLFGECTEVDVSATF